MSHLLILLLLISIHITFSSIFRSFTNPFLKTKSSKSENDSLVVPIETQSANTTTSIPDIDSSPGKNTIKRDIVIIGSGPSGLTAAIYTGRALLKPLVVAGYEAGGQLMLTNDVENFPGYRHAVTGPELIADLTEQAKTFGAELWQTNCQYINTSVYPFELHLPNCTVTARAIIIATGADSIWLNALDEDQFKGKGISTCATCDGYIFRNKPIVVIGGGDSAMEEATFLTRFASSVTVIHRSESFRASKVSFFELLVN